MLIPALHALQMRADTVLLAHAFFGLHNGDLVVARIAFHPSPIFGGALRQDLRSDGIQSVYVAKEMHDVLGPGEQWQVSLDDDSVETVVYKEQRPTKKAS